MKKIITLLAVIGMFSFQSCTTNTDNDTISEVFELNNFNFYNDPNISNRLEALKLAVQSNQLSPFAAAQELLNAYFKK